MADQASITWKGFVAELVRQFCQERGERTFTLQELLLFAREPMARFAPDNHHRDAKLRQTLQYLRADHLLAFVDNRGTYRLEVATLGEIEVEVEAVPLLQKFQGLPVKREYLVEIYARDRGWVRLARQTFGRRCLYKGCENTFFKDDGTPYCEVHHLVPLCEGGAESLWNLSVLCAHHHRMAHFARAAERHELGRCCKTKRGNFCSTGV